MTGAQKAEDEFRRLLRLRMKPASAMRWALLNGSREGSLPRLVAEEVWRGFQKDEGIVPITPLE